MQTMFRRSWLHAAVAAAMLTAVLLPLAGCAARTSEPSSSVDLGPFKKMVEDGLCADIRNRLFLIDDKLVFRDQAGNCDDAAYSQALYGSTPEEVLCLTHDSIAGPVKECKDATYEAIFETILANLYVPDLGLGADHSVQSVDF